MFKIRAFFMITLWVWVYVRVGIYSYMEDTLMTTPFH